MIKKLLPFFVIAILLCGCTASEGQQYKDNAYIDNTIEVKVNSLAAAWVTTIWNTDYPSKATTNSTQLKQEIDILISKAAAAKLNALFFQVRSCADALYKSNIFPWSKWLTGAQGLAPGNSFDPLEYFVLKAKQQGIQLHAWINPYRITASTSDTLTPTHPAVLNPELTIEINGKLYFNPGEPLARELIINGVCEIVQNYDIDGIHFDDYFYPEGFTNEDAQAWDNYGKGFNSIADWRRNNVDELIRQTYQAIKGINPKVVFGVSPSGIWANKSSNTLGSNTSGFQSYYAIFADSRGWVKKGYVDYIAPQIYWHIGQTGSDFLTVLKWWQDVCAGTPVELYVGIASYKNFEEQEYKNQIELAKEKGNGFILFSFSNAY